MASTRPFLTAEAASSSVSFGNASGITFSNGSGSRVVGSRGGSRRRGGRVRHTAPPSFEGCQEPAPLPQRVALGQAGTGRSSSLAGAGVCARPGLDGVGAFHHNHKVQGVLGPGRPVLDNVGSLHNLQSQVSLGSEFCGRRSTRLVSKFHHGRQKRYAGKHSAEADSAAEEIVNAGSAVKLSLVLDQWAEKLVPAEDFPFLLHELTNLGEWEKALRSFEWMVRQPHLRGERSKLASIMISTLGRLGKVDVAHEVFRRAHSAGFGDNVYAFSALVSAYGRSGRCKEALEVFQRMKKSHCKPNLVTYNSIIDACGKGGVDLRQALEIFQEMQREGVQPDRITFNTLIAVCSRGGLWEESQTVFNEMQRRGIEQDIFTYNTLIDAVCKGGQMDLAAIILESMRERSISPNVVTYSTMIDGYGKKRCFDQAISLHYEMQEADIRPDRVSYNTLVDIYAKIGRFDDALRTCSEMERAGWKIDVVTYNALIDSYGKQGRYEDAIFWLRKMKRGGVVPNVLTYSALIDAYSKGGLHEEANDILQEFKKAGLASDVVLYSALIDAYCKSGLLDKAAALIDEMAQQGIQPNIVTYNSRIDAFGRKNEKDKGANTAGDDTRDQISSTSSLNTELARTSGKELCLSSCDQAPEIRGKFTAPVSSDKGNRESLVATAQIVHEMRESGMRPNVVTFSAILNACSRCASFEEACALLEQMKVLDDKVYGVTHGMLMGVRQMIWGDAEGLFDQISGMDYSTAAAFYNALTDVLWHFGQKEGAQTVVVAANQRRVWENAWFISDQQFCLDLHLMSVGAALAMLHVWLVHIRCLVWDGHELPKFFSILTGWGKHSKIVGASALKTTVKTHLVELGAPFQVAKYNEGRLTCARYVLTEWMRNLNTLSQLLLHDLRSSPYPNMAEPLPNLQILSLGRCLEASC